LFVASLHLSFSVLLHFQVAPRLTPRLGFINDDSHTSTSYALLSLLIPSSPAATTTQNDDDNGDDNVYDYSCDDASTRT